MSGTAGSISITGSDAEFALLCDTDAAAGTVTPFLRRYTTSPTGAVTVADTELDGSTPYAPAGTIGVCAAPAPQSVELTAHGTQDTAWSLAANPGTVSVTLVVYAGAVTVTTGEGALTVPAGATLTWSGEEEPGGGLLAGTLSIDGAAPASWHVIWTTRP